MDFITKRYITFLSHYLNNIEKQNKFLYHLGETSRSYSDYLKPLYSGRSVTIKEILISVEHLKLDPIILFYDDPVDIIKSEAKDIGNKMRDIIVEKRISKNLILNSLKISTERLDDFIDGNAVIPAYKLKKFAQITHTSLAEFNSTENFKSEREIRLERTIDKYKEDNNDISKD